MFSQRLHMSMSWKRNMHSMTELPSGFRLPSSTYRCLKTSIDLLSRNYSIAFHELVKKCQDPAYKMTQDSEQKATSLALIILGTVPEETRQVVLSVAGISEAGMSAFVI